MKETLRELAEAPGQPHGPGHRDGRSPLARLLLEEVLSKGNRVPFRVKGTSLLPLVRPGESLLLECAKPDSIKRGELVVFDRVDGIIAHRVLRKRRTAEGYRFQTAGQWARIPDLLLAHESDVLGRVVEIADCPQGTARRAAPSGWSARLWSWRAWIQCYLHRVRQRLSLSEFA